MFLQAKFDFLPIFFMGTLVLMLFAFTLVIFLIVHKKKHFQHILEKQAIENSYQNQLLQSKLEVQEQSFRYFSEEIHDNVGQLLSIVKMQLYNIKSSSKEQEVVTKATDCTELLGKAINDLRNISHTLNSAYVSSAGLAAAVEKDLEYVRSAKDVKCTLHRTGEEYELDDERELMVFRIIQEAVGNAIKHASARAIDVSLDYHPDKLCVTIADNGKGFNVKEPHSGGIGLNNMHVRTDLLKGKMEVTSEHDKGTTIKLEIETPETTS
jgi:two-component system, NarL family, sensor kinase